MTYDGFISYSHAADGHLAPALQASLEQFAKPWWKRRALRIFRDQTGLSAAPHLWGAIETALDDSRFLILLASPQAAQSEWVGKEIAHWVEHNGPHEVLVVVTDGSWRWDPTVNDLDWTASSAAHPALAGVFVDEPRHVDLSWARTTDHLDQRDGRFNDAVADLAAALHGVAKDEIAGADVRQHRRTVRTAWSAVGLLAILTVLAITAGVMATVQKAQADREARRADNAATRALARSAAGSAIAQTPVRLDRALLLGANAASIEDTPQSETALLTGLQAARNLVGYHPHVSGTAGGFDLSSDGKRLVTVDEGGDIAVWGRDRWDRLASRRVSDLEAPYRTQFRDDAMSVFVAAAAGGRLLAADTLRPTSPMLVPTPAIVGDAPVVSAVNSVTSLYAVTRRGAGQVEIHDTAAGATVATATIDCPAGVSDLAFTPDDTLLAVLCGHPADSLDGYLALLDPRTGESVRRTTDTAIAVGDRIWFAPDGSSVAVTTSRDPFASVFDTASLTQTALIDLHSGSPTSVAFDPSRQMILVSTDDGSLQAFDPASGAVAGPVFDELTSLWKVDGLEIGSPAIAIEPAGSPEPYGGPTGPRVLTATGNGIAEWDIGSRSSLGRLEAAPFTSLALDADRNRWYASGSYESLNGAADIPQNAITVHDIDTGSVTRLPLAAEAFPETLGPDGAQLAIVEPIVATISNDGRRLFVTPERLSGTSVILAPSDPLSVSLPPVLVDTASGAVTPLEVVDATAASACCVDAVFSPDGTEAAAVQVGPGRVTVWDVDSGRAVASELSDGAEAISWTADSSELVIAMDDGTLDFVTPSTLQAVATLRLGVSQHVRSMEAPAGAHRLTVTVESGLVWFVDTATHRLDGAPFRSGTALIASTVSPDGQRLAAIGEDGALHIWEVASRTAIGPPLVFGGEVKASADIGFTSGHDVVALSGINGLATWDLDPNAWIKRACDVAGRDLGATEWRQYIGGDPRPTACR